MFLLKNGLLAYTTEVAAIAGVNLDSLALVNEQRNANLSTSLESSWLGSVGSSVTLYTWLRVSDLQGSLCWHFSQEDSTVCSISNNLNYVTLLHVLTTGNVLLSDRHLLESLLVHEDATSSVLVEVLIRATLNANILQQEDCALIE